MGSYKNTHRVSKRDTGKKRGRGRPQAYSESWKKKVVVLRSCGLDLKDILDLLERQEGSEFKAKVRRSQQIIQELLGDGNDRFTPPEKEVARALARFIRARRPRNCRSSSRGISSLERALTSPVADMSSPISPDESMNSKSRSYHIGASAQAIDGGFSQKPQPDLDVEKSGGKTASGSINQTYQLGLVCNTLAARNHVFSQETSHLTFDIGRQLFLKNQLRARLRRLSNASFSSSFLSDLASLLGRRNSCSTLDTTDTFSISAFSEAVTKPKTTADKVKKTLELRKQEDVVENTALISRCCSQEAFCIHKVVREFTEEYLESQHMPRSEPLRSDSLVNYLLAPHQTSTPIQVHENDTLFFAARIGDPAELIMSPVIQIRETDALCFAARIGAPAEFLLSLATWVPNNSFITSNGQTWLHCADPRLFSASGCCCDTPNDHVSKFQCIPSAPMLDQIDDHGRHFLFYICSSPDFDLIVLARLVQQHSRWAERIASASQIRDRAGLFLLDYVSLHADFSSLSEEMQSLFQPHLDPEPYPLRILHGEGANGRTVLHSYVEKGDFMDYFNSLPRETSVIGEQINRYDDKGHTPIMSYLDYAFETNEKESRVCRKVRKLALYGANVNARSRSGATILHFAAKRGAVQLLDVLLDALGARIDIRDDNGDSAADYVAKAIRASQHAKRPARLLARSIKVAGKLLPLQSGQSATSGTQPEISTMPVADAKAHLRSMLQSLP